MYKQVIFSITILIMIFNHYPSYTQTLKIDSVISKINILEENVKEVRRDQLNYKVEKDLLKETYLLVIILLIQ